MTCRTGFPDHCHTGKALENPEIRLIINAHSSSGQAMGDLLIQLSEEVEGAVGAPVLQFP